MIDDGPMLTELCNRNLNSTPGTIHLRHRATINDLQALAECEVFDVVLALNVLHHFPNWRRALTAVCNLGAHIVIETPPPTDTGACGQHAIPGIYDALQGTNNARRIASTPSHTSPVERPMYLLDSTTAGDTARRYTRSYIDAPSKAPNGPRQVTSTYDTQSVVFERKRERRPWLPGINLRTYQYLNGAYPTPATIATWLDEYPLPTTRHGDIRPWNFILDGNCVHLIDGRDAVAVYDDAQGLRLTAQAIRQEVPGAYY
jgi:hypothetical protein